MSKKFNIKKSLSNALDVCMRLFGQPDKLFNLLNDVEMSYDDVTNADTLAITKESNSVVSFYDNKKIEIDTHSDVLPLTDNTYSVNISLNSGVTLSPLANFFYWDSSTSFLSGGTLNASPHTVSLRGVIGPLYASGATSWRVTASNIWTTGATGLQQLTLWMTDYTGGDMYCGTQSANNVAGTGETIVRTMTLDPTVVFPHPFTEPFYLGVYLNDSATGATTASMNILLEAINKKYKNHYTPPQVEFVGLYTPTFAASSLSGTTLPKLTGISYVTVRNNGTSGMTDHKFTVSIEASSSSGANKSRSYFTSYLVNTGLIELVPGNDELTIPCYYYPGYGGTSMVLLNKHNMSFSFYSGKTSVGIYTKYKYKTIIKDAYFETVLKPDYVFSGSTDLATITGTTDTYTTKIDFNNPYISGIVLDYVEFENKYNWVGVEYTTGFTSTNYINFFYSSATYETLVMNPGNSLSAYTTSLGGFDLVSNQITTIGEGTPIKLVANFDEVHANSRLQIRLINSNFDSVSPIFYVSGVTGGTYEWETTTLMSAATYQYQIYNNPAGSPSGFKGTFGVYLTGVTQTQTTGSYSKKDKYTIGGTANHSWTITPYTFFSGTTYKTGSCTITTNVYDREPFNKPSISNGQNFSWSF